jgi:type I restriction enzyme R subunit
MSLNESTVEEATLEWFGELGYAVGHLPAPRSATRQAGGRHLAPGEPAAERDGFGDVVQSRVARTLTRPLPRGEEKREAIRRPAGAGPAIPEVALRVGFLPFQPDTLN